MNSILRLLDSKRFNYGVTLLNTPNKYKNKPMYIININILGHVDITENNINAHTAIKFINVILINLGNNKS